MEIVKISAHAYQLHNRPSGINVGCVVTDDGVILIDTGSSEKMAAEIAGTVREITNRPITYAINTHAHRDHTGGNGFFEVPVIAHQSCYEELERARNARELARPGRQNGDGRDEDAIQLPSICFSDDGYLYAGGLLISIAHSPGHTDGAVVVHIPEERVVFAGDNIWVDSYPVIDRADPFQWRASLFRMQQMNAKHLVPGRGRLAQSDDLDTMYQYFDNLITTAESLRREGMSRERILASERFLRLDTTGECPAHRENINQVMKSIADR
jgi:cyclase